MTPVFYHIGRKVRNGARRPSPLVHIGKNRPAVKIGRMRPAYPESLSYGEVALHV